LRRNPHLPHSASTITIAFHASSPSSRPLIAPARPERIGYLIDKVRPQSNPIPGPEPGFPAGRGRPGPGPASHALIVGSSQQTLIVGRLCDDLSRPDSAD
jgi:peptide/nickel transport system permease protein